MKFYIIYGKWDTSRFGVNEGIERRILYLPDENLKFSVDDRDIRNLSRLEEESLKYLIGSKVPNIDTSWGSKNKNKLKLVEKNADKNLVSKIIKAYGNKDRKFFFSL